MHKVLVLGAGKIGTLISGLLGESGSYEVHLGDVNEGAAAAVVAAHALPGLHAHQVDAADPAALDRHLRAHRVDAVISSLPYYCNIAVAEAARRAGIHYFDLTEDVEVTRNVRRASAGVGRRPSRSRSSARTSRPASRWGPVATAAPPIMSRISSASGGRKVHRCAPRCC